MTWHLSTWCFRRGRRRIRGRTWAPSSWRTGTRKRKGGRSSARSGGRYLGSWTSSSWSCSPAPPWSRPSGVSSCLPTTPMPTRKLTEMLKWLWLPDLVNKHPLCCEKYISSEYSILKDIKFTRFIFFYIKNMFLSFYRWYCKLFVSVLFFYYRCNALHAH